MKCGCTGGFLLFDGEWGKILLLANLFSHLSSLKMWKFLSGFGRTRWADTAAAFLGRPEFSRIQLLTQVWAFLRVKRGNLFHIRERRLNISPLVIGTLLFSFIEHLIWFNGRITYCLFSAAVRDEGVRRCFHARSVRSVSIVRAPLLFRSRSVAFSGEIGSPLFGQPSVQIRNLIRNSNLDNKRRPPDGFGWATLGRIILFCTSSSLSSSLDGLGNLHCSFVYSGRQYPSFIFSGLLYRSRFLLPAQNIALFIWFLLKNLGNFFWEKSFFFKISW